MKFAPAAAVAAAIVLWGAAPAWLSAEKKVEKNVVYGMYSGLGLLMDVYQPENPNGYGIIHIAGSGWSRPLSLDAPQIKDGDQPSQLAVHVPVSRLILVAGPKQRQAGELEPRLPGETGLLCRVPLLSSHGHPRPI